MRETQKPLSLKVKEVKSKVLTELINSDLHPVIISYVMDDIKKELIEVVRKTEEYENEEYKKAAGRYENKESAENGES